MRSSWILLSKPGIVLASCLILCAGTATAEERKHARPLLWQLKWREGGMKP
jgi:hypothetical protein